MRDDAKIIKEASHLLSRELGEALSEFDRATRRVLRRVGLALLAALLVGAVIGVAT